MNAKDARDMMKNRDKYRLQELQKSVFDRVERTAKLGGAYLVLTPSVAADIFFYPDMLDKLIEDLTNRGFEIDHRKPKVIAYKHNGVDLRDEVTERMVIKW
jgi:hypothetical protein